MNSRIEMAAVCQPLRAQADRASFVEIGDSVKRLRIVAVGELDDFLDRRCDSRLKKGRLADGEILKRTVHPESVLHCRWSARV